MTKKDRLYFTLFNFIKENETKFDSFIKKENITSNFGSKDVLSFLYFKYNIN